MSIGTQSQSDSQYLTSSVSSLRRPKKSTSEISKTYKHASQLYLTRRLVECYEALQPVIRPFPKAEKENGHISQSEEDTTHPSPIASASTSQRIKIWSLYATLLNTVVELGDEEGKRDFGNKLYREIVRNVQSGEVWEQVVRDGYMNHEASVDAEVVYNLSNLLLAQAPTQMVNQSRLETYLSSSPHGNLDFSAAFQNGSKHSTTNGMDTPKDLNSRIKILELFTLHVLPRNNEWDYARSFVKNSDILDDERREAFLQTLNELQEAKEQEDTDAGQDLVGFADETEDETVESTQDRIQMNAEDEDQAAVDTQDVQKSNGHSSQHHQPVATGRKNLHRRTSSEVDYGIDDDFLRSQGAQKQLPQQPTSQAHGTKSSSRAISPTPTAPPPSSASATSRVSTSTSPPPPMLTPATRKPSTMPARRPASNKKSSSTQSQGVVGRIAKVLHLLSQISASWIHSLTRNPTNMFRTLMFLCVFIAILARKDIRERLKRIIYQGLGKVRSTAGMGMKVSYI